jgi:tripartite-type tricarboxylate transporter receptor subunit TctC
MKAISLVAAVFVVSACVHTASWAQGWPQRPIRVVVPNSPGGGSDTLARGMIEPLARSLGQPVFVENRGGASGIIGTEACAKADPDGHTLCSTSSGLLIWNMVLNTKLPYHTVRDLAPVIQAGFFDSVLVVHASVPVDSFQGLLAYARSNPGKVNWGHSGVNDTSYMYEEWLKRSRDAPFYPVPYKSHAQANLATITGETHVRLNATGNLAPHIKAGKLRPLAVTGGKRLDWLPNVPTFDELGIKLPLQAWSGYHYPIATPREIVLRLNTEMRRIMDQPDYRKNIMERVGISPHVGTAADFDAFIRTQLKEVAELVVAIGVKPE